MNIFFITYLYQIQFELEIMNFSNLTIDNEYFINPFALKFIYC